MKRDRNVWENSSFQFPHFITGNRSGSGITSNGKKWDIQVMETGGTGKFIERYYCLIFIHFA